MSEVITNHLDVLHELERLQKILSTEISELRCQAAAYFQVQPPKSCVLQEAEKLPDGTFKTPHWVEQITSGRTGDGRIQNLIPAEEFMEHLLQPGVWTGIGGEDDQYYRRITDVVWEEEDATGRQKLHEARSNRPSADVLEMLGGPTWAAFYRLLQNVSRIPPCAFGSTYVFFRVQLDPLHRTETPTLEAVCVRTHAVKFTFRVPWDVIREGGHELDDFCRRARRDEAGKV